MTLKPCIKCGKDCEILPVQLGDIFTLSYLRVCSAECMFLIAYEYMREHCIHKQFRGSLYDKQIEEDKKERDEWVNEVTNESLRMMRENLEKTPELLSTPVPSLISEMFASMPPIPTRGPPMRFTRPKIEDRIKWQSEHISRLKDQLKEAYDDLKKLENES